MVWLSWRKYKALVKDCWPSDFADTAVNARNLDKLIMYSQAAPNKLPEISASAPRAALPPLSFLCSCVGAGTWSTACRSTASGGARAT
jgi:hypothetical protein